MPAPHPFLQYWHRALSEPFGIAVKFLGEATAIKTSLYTARARANDPLLSAVTIRTSPRSPKDELWLVVDRSKLPGGEALGAPA